MTTTLERAARAAYESPHGPQRLWSDLSEVGKELARNQVRAILMAVREPDDATVTRATDGGYYSAPDLEIHFTATIDAILSESP